MPRFFVVRHGQTEWNAQLIQQGWSDSPLTAEGIEKTRQLATLLPQTTTHIFTSDLDRAQNSAELLKGALDHPTIITDWRLRERGYGELEGQPIDDSEIAATYVDPQASYRGAEPVAHIEERLKRFIQDCALFDFEEYVIVTHNGVLNRLNSLLHDDHTHQRHDNASVYEFELDFADPRLQPGTVAPWSPAR